MQSRPYTAHICPDYEGNTYAQLPGLAYLALQNADDPERYATISMDTYILSPEEEVKDYLFDDTANIVTFGE